MHAQLQQAIDLADEHDGVVSTAKHLKQEFETLLFSIGQARGEGSARFRTQQHELLADIEGFRARFDDLVATAQHDLNNAEQAVVILRSGVAA